MNCSGEILNLEYSGATFWCVLGMRILLFFLFLSLEALCRTQKEQQLEEMSGFGETKEAVLHENYLKYQCLWNVDLAMHTARNNP